MCHETIVKMYDCFTEQILGSFSFGIVTEYFELGDLEDEIKRERGPTIGGEMKICGKFSDVS
jgi:hypothetical protein